MNNISSTDAGQRFSELLEKVEQGEGFAITRNGETIATLQPQSRREKANAFQSRSFEEKMKDPQWAAAYRRMVALMDEGAHLGDLKIDREELYDRADKKAAA